MRDLTSAELAQIFRAPPITIRKWKQLGLIRPVEPARSRVDEYSPTQSLGIGLMLALRRRGLPVAAAVAAYQYFSNRTWADLEADFLADRTHLVACGESILPQLFKRSDVVGNVPLMEMASELGEPWAVVDVAAAAMKLMRAVVGCYIPRPGGSSQLAVPPGPSRDGVPA